MNEASFKKNMTTQKNLLEAMEDNVPSGDKAEITLSETL